MAAPYTLTVKQGDDFEKTFVCKVDGVVQNLSGYTVNGQVRATATHPSVLATITATVLDGPAGRIKLTIPFAVTALIPAMPGTGFDPSVYWYDIQIISTSGKRDTIFEGPFYLIPEVTRNA